MTTNHIDLDGSEKRTVQLRYALESHLPCYFGGIGLGGDGENVDSRSLHSLFDINKLPESIKFIHCDSQRAENLFLLQAKTISTTLSCCFIQGEFKICTVYNHVCEHYPELKVYFDVHPAVRHHIARVRKSHSVTGSSTTVATTISSTLSLPDNPTTRAPCVYVVIAWDRTATNCPHARCVHIVG